MGAWFTLAGIVLGGVTGGVTFGKLGAKIEENASEKERQNFRWACNRLGVPVPDDPNNPSSGWETQADRSFENLPEEEKEEIREVVKEELGLELRSA